MPLTPKNRKEEWIQGLVDHETTLTPKNRPEEWMKEIIDASGSGGGGGTGGGVLVVGIDMDTMTLDKTWNEINSAPFAVSLVLYDESDEGDGSIISKEFNICIGTTSDESTGYYVKFATIAQSGTVVAQFHTNSADGYPVLQE